MIDIKISINDCFRDLLFVLSRHMVQKTVIMTFSNCTLAPPRTVEDSAY